MMITREEMRRRWICAEVKLESVKMELDAHISTGLPGSECHRISVSVEKVLANIKNEIYPINITQICERSDWHLETSIRRLKEKLPPEPEDKSQSGWVDCLYFTDAECLIRFVFADQCENQAPTSDWGKSDGIPEDELTDRQLDLIDVESPSGDWIIPR